MCPVTCLVHLGSCGTTHTCCVTRAFYVAQACCTSQLFLQRVHVPYHVLGDPLLPRSHVVPAYYVTYVPAMPHALALLQTSPIPCGIHVLSLPPCHMGLATPLHHRVPCYVSLCVHTLLHHHIHCDVASSHTHPCMLVHLFYLYCAAIVLFEMLCATKHHHMASHHHILLHIHARAHTLSYVIP